MVAKENADRTSEFATEQATKILDSQENLIVPVETAKIVEQIIDEVLQEITAAKTLPRKIKKWLKGIKNGSWPYLEKSNQITACVLDCQAVANNEDTANYLITKILIEIADKFCKEFPAAEVMPGGKELLTLNNLTLIVTKLLEKLKLKSKADKQLLLVKNIDLIEEKDRESIINLLMNYLSGHETLQVVIFKTPPVKP